MKTLLIWMLVASSCFAQDMFDTSIVVKQQPDLVAVSGESASVAQLKDSVVVTLSKSNGVFLRVVDVLVTTNATKYNLIVKTSTGKRYPVTRASDGSFRLMAPIGVYAAQVILLDDDLGFDTFDTTITVGSGTAPPPIDPPPPVAGLETLRKVSKDKAIELNDPATAKVLSAAYKAAGPMIVGKTLAESQTIVKQLRFNVLANRPKPVKADWNNWLVAVDSEVVKYVGESQERYVQAVAAIAQSLE